MMKYFLTLFCIALFISCEKPLPANVTVSGQVRGLKKGTLYLERFQDTALVVLDSMLINGNPDFLLQTRLEEPEVLYLSLDANSDEIPRVEFFADSGTTSIYTSLKRFVHDAKIEGSEQQELMNTYNEMMTQFNDKNLELIKAQFESQNDSIKLDSLNRVSNNLLKSKYRYTFNYALNNKESEVAPYLVLSEVFDANITYIDTIYKVLPENIANSKYGKQLSQFISEIKQDSLSQ